MFGIDVENSEAGVGEMRDVIGVDELPAGLLVAVIRTLCPHRLRCFRAAGRAALVQGLGTALEW